MYLFDKIKENCSGCRACEAVCPTNCISFKEDEETFIYPLRDTSKCIDCHLCETVCPISSEVERHRPIDQKVGIHKCSEIVFQSSSGGAFSAICELLVPAGYKVYGVKLDDNLKCVFSGTEDVEGCQSFRKSKYIQADTNDIYRRIQQDLQEGKKVLFTGLPCQNAALKLYLNKKKIEAKNLIAVDILCHGVVSQGIFDKYLEELSSTKGSKVVGYIFRNKHKIDGKVNTRSVEVTYADGSLSYYGISDTAYLRGYHVRLFYRPSCYQCPYANDNRVGDITLADAWGIEKRYSDWNSLAGVSLLLANTEKGKIILQKLCAYNMDLREIELEWAIAGNDTLRGPTKMHPNRHRFFKQWRKNGFSRTVNRYAFPPLPRRVMNRLIRNIKKLF